MRMTSLSFSFPQSHQSCGSFCYRFLDRLCCLFLTGWCQRLYVYSCLHRGSSAYPFGQSHFFSALLIRLSGSRAVLALVSFFFMPVMRLQKLSRRLPAFSDFAAILLLTGGLRLWPCALADLRPAALSPPDSDLPSLRCHAALTQSALCDTHLFCQRSAHQPGCLLLHKSNEPTRCSSRRYSILK